MLAIFFNHFTTQRLYKNLPQDLPCLARLALEQALGVSDTATKIPFQPDLVYFNDEVIQPLRTVELDTGTGLAVRDACRKRGITEQTSYRGKKEYGGLRVDQAKRLKSLEQENARLKRIVADLSLDNSILKEVASGNSGPPIDIGHGRTRVRSRGVSESLRSPRHTAIWVSHGHGSVEAGGLGRGEGSRVYDLAAGRPPSAAEAAEARAPLAGERFLCAHAA